ncbi:hypothetical protein QL093DRAFT_2570404 [Fusarium oxysporum]|nr:hypothetical protein QL093DRAFT_2570404 [Fusarium oxysporum]
MAYFLFFLALLGLITANLTGFSGRKGILNRDFAGIGSILLALPASCSSSEINCGRSCIAGSGECCSVSKGSYCKAGKYYINNRCCPKGEICTGEAASCSTSRQLCSKYYILNSAVYYSNSSYYNSRETCTSDGFCSKGKGSSNSNQGNILCKYKGRSGGGNGNNGNGGDNNGCSSNGARSMLAPSFASILLVVFVLML